jgi:hypothetical protein
MSHQGHTIKITMGISMGPRVTILKALIMDPLIEVAILGSAEITQTKVQAAGFLGPDLPLTTTALHTAEAGATSTIHNGPCLDLVAGVDRIAPLRTAVARRLRLLVLRPQAIRYLLGPPILVMNLLSQTGIIKETMTGLGLRQKMTVLMTCSRLPVIQI